MYVTQEKDCRKEKAKEIIASQINRRKSASKKSILLEDDGFCQAEITRTYRGNSVVGECDYADESGVLA